MSPHCLRRIGRHPVILHHATVDVLLPPEAPGVIRRTLDLGGLVGTVVPDFRGIVLPQGVVLELDQASDRSEHMLAFLTKFINDCLLS